MLLDRKRRWIVVIVTKTDDEDAIRNWTDELSRLGCKTVFVEPEDLMVYIGDRKQMDAVMFDDVSPDNTPEIRDLAHVATSMRPEPKITFLVAEHDDWDGLQHLIGHHGHESVHRDGQPMDAVYRHLASMNGSSETPAGLLH